MYAQLTHIHPLAVIRRNRNLPAVGEVLVRPGQQVNALEPVARAVMPTRHYLVDIARAFSIQKPLEAEKLLQRRVGDDLEKGDILASTGGAFSRVIRTPGKGKVVSIQGGRVLIEAENKEIDVKAGMDGVISKVFPDHGVTVEMSGVLVQGIWGNGKVGRGILVAEENVMSCELDQSALTASAAGAILLAGWCSNEEMLTAAAQAGINGLVLGSIRASLIPVAEKQPYALISLGGFGEFGFDPLSHKLLSTNAGRETALNANRWNRRTGDRPEITIALPAEAYPMEEFLEYAPGQTVRVHASTYLGRTGMIKRILPGQYSLPGGIRTPALEVKFSEEEVAVVPAVNVDVIGLPSPFLGEEEGS